jgi:H+/Cl- antiporter ClcA
MLAMSRAVPARELSRALLPGFVAAGSGALIFTGVAGWEGLHQHNLAPPQLPSYDTVRIADLGWCAVLALAIGVVIVAARRLAFGISARAVSRPAAALVVAGLLVGLVGVAFRELAERPVDLVLFSGQSALPALVAEQAGGVLLLVDVAKGLAYSLSLGAGFRGGPVFPAIAIGTALAVAAADLLPGSSPRQPSPPASPPRPPSSSGPPSALRCWRRCSPGRRPPIPGRSSFGPR